MTSPKEEKRQRLARDILLAAEEYRRGAICLETYGILVSKALDPHLTFPMAVYYAFAAELYLKFLYCVRTTRDIPATHDLENLFKNLPKDVRPIIKRHWENPPEIEKKTRAAASAFTGRPIPTFDEALKRSANIFVKLRYHYEDQGMKDFDLQLGSALRAAIFEIYPTEYADIRLPLPIGALNADQQNSVAIAARKPANPPENP
jgi:hypothetical protein